ncbi:MAG TPA: MlaD family protein [Solirubrobacteraceae bacterium]|jgi:virulence factor Mce-like protein|nr:MlaD family protein [Solirubrobacteraceae bacterium]
MRRILLSLSVVLAAAAVVGIVAACGASSASSGGDPTYTIELNNAFGLVNGEQFKIAGVPAGSITSISLDPKSLNALVKVSVTGGGSGTFHTDATCQSRPQSLIGEYFIDCTPGTPNAPVLRTGGRIPVSHTFSTIPADLLQNTLRMPYRERLTLIINELGAAVAGNPANLQSTLKRAVPALTQTDNLLALLAQDSRTIENLTATANSVITALANNGRGVRHFVVAANKTAVASAQQRVNLQATFHNLPSFLQQLRPALASLGSAADANEPVLTNLNASSGEINRLFADLVPFSHSAKPAVSSLGRASATGHQAVVAAGPTVAHLNQFAQPTPELAQNLAIVLHDLDTQSKAVEPDPRSPGGKGYSGIEALLQYAFEQTNAIDYFGQFGHILAVDGFVSKCSPYQTGATIASNLALYGPSFRQCYQFLGPNQPGVNERDPSNPTGTIPDPGGAPPGEPGPTGSITTSTATRAPRAKGARTKAKVKVSSRPQQTAPTGTMPPSGSSGGGSSGAPGSGSGSGTGTTTTPTQSPAPGINLGALGQLLNGVLGTQSGSTSGGGLGSLLGGGSSGGLGSLLSGTSSSNATSNASSANSASTPQQAQQLLNYLLAP